MRRIVRGYEKKEQAITVLLQSLNENKKVESSFEIKRYGFKC